MRKKKWITSNKRHKVRMLKLVLAFFLFMGIGYSALSTKYGRPVHSRLSGSVTIFLAGEIIILSIYVPQKHFMNIL